MVQWKYQLSLLSCKLRKNSDMANIINPGEDTAIEINIPKEKTLSKVSHIDLPDLTEDRNPILREMDKSVSDYYWKDHNNLRGAYTIVKKQISTLETLSDWITELEFAKTYANDLKPRLEISNYQELLGTLKEAKARHRAMSKDLENKKAKSDNVLTPKAIADYFKSFENKNLVKKTVDPDWPYLVAFDGDFIGFNPEYDSMIILDGEVRLALCAALVSADRLRLSIENTDIFTAFVKGKAY